MTAKSKNPLEDKKKRILRAAQRCFSRYGFAKTTLDDIATGVGMQKASLYYYYESKDAIFREVIEDETRELLETLDRKLTRLPSAVDKLYAFAKIRLDYFREFINLNDLSINVILEVKPLIDRLYQDFRLQQIGVLVGILQDGIQKGELKPCDVSRAAEAIFTILEAVAIRELQHAEMQAVRDLDYKKLEQEIKYVLSLVITGLKQ